MAVVAIAISFLVIILSLVISSGFRKEMREGVSSLTGDIQLCSPAANMYDSEVSVNSEPAWLDAILAHKAVEKITPAIYRTGIVQSGEDLQGVLFKAVPTQDTIPLLVSIPGNRFIRRNGRTSLGSPIRITKEGCR